MDRSSGQTALSISLPKWRNSEGYNPVVAIADDMLGWGSSPVSHERAEHHRLDVPCARTERNREWRCLRNLSRNAHAAIAHGNDEATALGVAAQLIALNEHDTTTALKLFDRALELSNSMPSHSGAMPYPRFDG